MQSIPNVEPEKAVHEDFLGDEAISRDEELTDHKSEPLQVQKESPNYVPTPRKSLRLRKSPLIYQADAGEYMERET